MTVCNNGLAALSQLLPTDLTSLPGTVTTAASVGPFTVTVDLRDYCVVGDLITFSGQANVVYGIAAMAATTVTLTIAYAGTTGAGQTMQKCTFNHPQAGGVSTTAVSSPAQSAGAGTAGATLASTAVTGVGTAYNTLFVAGDSIIFTADNPTRAYVIRTVTSATAMVLEQNYTGTTATGKAYQKANFSPRRQDTSSTTNKGGRFGAVALGTTSTASGATDTGLGAEITTGGGSRQSGTNASTGVTTYLTSADAGVSWKSTWSTTFTFSAGFSLFELGIFNDPVANRGICLLRQVFAAVLTVVATDVLNLVVSLTHSATATATGVVASIGLKEAAKLCMDNGTNKGTDSPTTPGSTWTSVQGTQFDTIALGTGSTAPALTQVALVTEISANGTTRQTGTGVAGTIQRDPDNANVTPFVFSTDGFTTFVGDTVQWHATFSITGTQAIREQAVLNGSVAGDNDPAAGSRMLIRQVFAADLNLVNTDTYVPIIRLQSQ